MKKMIFFFLMRFPPPNPSHPPASVPRSSRAALPVPERFVSEGDEEGEAAGDESTEMVGGGAEEEERLLMSCEGGKKE